MLITCRTHSQTGLMGGILGVAWYIATGSSSGKMTIPGPKNNYVKRAVKAQVDDDTPLSDS
jgi:hypothetical protein